MGDLRKLLRLAAAEQGARRLDRAEAACRKALRIKPHHPEAESRLANILQSRGRLRDALARYGRVAKRHPRYAPAHVGMGAIHLAQSKPQTARGCFEAALRVDPRRTDALFGVAVATEREGNFRAAAKAYLAVLRVDERHASSYNNLGNVLRALGQTDGAVKSLRKAAELKPASGEYAYNLGRALHQADQHEEATRQLERAVSLAPTFAPAAAGLARVYEVQNRAAEAAEAASKALGLDPDNLLANVVAATCEGRNGNRTPAIERLRRVLPLAKGHEDEMLVAGELAKLLDKEGACDEAFDLFTRANQCTLRMLGRQAERKNEIRDEIARLRSLYEVREPEACRDHAAAPWNGPSPVFLIGFPRSGTTLLEQVLDAHPLVQAMPEPTTIAAVKDRLGQGCGHYTERLAAVSSVEIAELRQVYFTAADGYVERRADCLLIDKNPLGLKDVGLILTLFPDARFIVAQRHPCDACLSCFMQQFKMNLAMINFLTLGDTATFYRDVIELWQVYQSVFTPRQHVVRYEDLVNEFENEVRGLVDFLELPFDEGVLRYAEHAAGRGRIRTPSYRQVVQPIYRSARFRWHNYREQLASVLPILDPFVKSLGYAS